MGHAVKSKHLLKRGVSKLIAVLQNWVTMPQHETPLALTVNGVNFQMSLKKHVY